jgi:hypothetical protein
MLDPQSPTPLLRACSQNLRIAHGQLFTLPDLPASLYKRASCADLSFAACGSSKLNMAVGGLLLDRHIVTDNS